LVVAFLPPQWLLLCFHEEWLSCASCKLQLNDRELRIGIEFEVLQPQLADTINRYLFTIEGTGD
jgi:hypothetical protein